MRPTCVILPARFALPLNILAWERTSRGQEVTPDPRHSGRAGQGSHGFMTTPYDRPSSIFGGGNLPSTPGPSTARVVLVAADHSQREDV